METKKLLWYATMEKKSNANGKLFFITWVSGFISNDRDKKGCLYILFSSWLRHHRLLSAQSWSLYLYTRLFLQLFWVHPQHQCEIAVMPESSHAYWILHTKHAHHHHGGLWVWYPVDHRISLVVQLISICGDLKVSVVLILSSTAGR